MTYRLRTHFDFFFSTFSQQRYVDYDRLIQVAHIPSYFRLFGLLKSPSFSVVSSCEAIVDVYGNKPCEWNYNGQGYQYQILAGPMFILIYTFVGVLLSAVADLTNRKIVSNSLR